MRWGYHHDRSENLGKPPEDRSRCLTLMFSSAFKAQCVETILFCPDRHNEHDAKQVKSADITLVGFMQWDISKVKPSSHLI